MKKKHVILDIIIIKKCVINTIVLVMLAHQQDDICENIFNNIMRGGREVTDLTVIREKNNILGVEIYRPMLEYYKDSILNIAHGYQIPYLDTTPD